ncbi:hypothetical protein NH340_JMT07259 [Sarcoptes scabiei]|nr:hypothetical protein NH340_JMT07259 [Sarcoptes scabiei]
MLKDQLPLISSIVNLSIIVSILIVLNSYQAFVIDRSFPKDWIQEVTQETLAQVPYKEFYGLPLECNSDRNLVETYQKCQNDSISAWKLKPEQLLTDSKEFCCFMKKVLSCETEPLRDCDEEYAKENSDETNQLLSACSESSLACQTAAQKDDESIWIIIISAVLSALGMAGLGFYCYPLRKFFLSKFTGKHLDLNYYNAIKNGWRMKILPRRFTTIKTQDLTDPSNVLEAAIRTDTTTIETRSSPVVTTETLAEKLSLKDADRVSLHATETPVKIDIDSNVVASKQDLVISIESKQISSPIKVEDVSKIKEPMGLTLKTDHTAFVGKQPIVESTPERISPIKQIEKIKPIETVAKMAPDETIKIVEKEKVAVVKDSTPFKTKELDESKPKTLATETRKSPIKELVKEKITAKTAVSQPKQQMEVKLIEKVVPEKTEKTFAKMAPEKRVAEKVAEKTVAKMVPEKSIVEVIPEKRLTKTAVASKQPTKIPKVSEPIVQTEPIKKVTMDSRKSPIPSKIPMAKTQPIETRLIQKAIQKQPTPDDDVMKFLQKPIETLSKQVQKPTTDDEILEFLQKPFDTSTSSSQQIRVESVKDPTEMSTRPPETPKTIGVKDVAGAEEKLIIAQTKAKDVPIADTTSRSIAKTQVEVDQTRPKPEPSKPKITEKPAGTDAPKEVQRQPIVKEPVQKPTVHGEDVEKISQSQRTFRQPSERIRAMQEV